MEVDQSRWLAEILAALRTSRRLDLQHPLDLSRAVLLLLKHPYDFGDDAEEAVVRALAKLTVTDSEVALTESPMEDLLIAAFERAGFVAGPLGFGRGDLLLTPQVEEGRYRIDFSLSAAQSKRRIAVEVDGHAYHDRTKDQASRDRERDRALQRRGWLVFRYTGSDVYRDADRCVAELIEALG